MLFWTLQVLLIKYLRSVNISKPVTDIYLKQVTVEHERNILFGGKKASVVKSPNAFEPAISRTA